MPMLKYKHIFKIKYTEPILSNSTRKLLWFEIQQNADYSLRKKFIVSFIIIFCTLSFPVPQRRCGPSRLRDDDDDHV